jgi:predicted pyridoxine 5'-phosphate oxidase superfamily flavin-nucleotide-binding protein
MDKPSSNVAFSPAVKRVQTERGSRRAYQRMEASGGFETEVDGRLRSFLAEIDTAFLATAGADGQPYVQHRGGPKGFVRVLDDRTLAIADLPGNQQYVTTGNLLDNDRVCLFLIDYARRRRVKVWGRARIVEATPEMVNLLGKGVERALLLTVSAWDVNCPKHIPQKLDAEEVERVLLLRDARIAELEAEIRTLESRIAKP